MATAGRLQRGGTGENASDVSTSRDVARVKATVLGGFSVAVDGRGIEPSAWGRASAERLVKLLLVTPDHSLSREDVGETLWPEAEPDRQATNVRKALHFARRAFDEATLGSPILSAARDRVGLAEGVDLDLDLDRLLDAISSLDASRRMGRHDDEAIGTVLALGQDPLLPADLYDEWLTALRDRLSWRWRDVALSEGRRALDGGDVERGHELARRILLQDPSDEDAHRLAIELFGRQGRHHAARRQFLECRRALLSIGVAPSPETIAAHRGRFGRDRNLVGEYLAVADDSHRLAVWSATSGDRHGLL